MDIDQFMEENTLTPKTEEADEFSRQLQISQNDLSAQEMSYFADFSCATGQGHEHEHANQFLSGGDLSGQTKRRTVSEVDPPVMGKLLSIPMKPQLTPLTTNHVTKKDPFDAEFEFLP